MIDTQQGTEVIIDILVDKISPSRIYLFGSRAKGDEKYNSDFDVAFEADDYKFRSYREALEALDLALGAYSIDLVDLNECSPEFRELVKEQGKVIYERD